MNGTEIILLMLVVLASASGQLLLSYSARGWRTGSGTVTFLLSVLKSPATVALLLVLGAPLLYWKALETVELSTAYAATALTGVLVQAGGKAVLKEPVTRRTLAGALLCCAGIAVWGL